MIKLHLAPLGSRHFPVLPILAQRSGEISPLSLNGEETWLANILTTTVRTKLWITSVIMKA